MSSGKRYKAFLLIVASISANLLQQKKGFTQEKISTGSSWPPNMNAILSIVLQPNMEDMTSCEDLCQAVAILSQEIKKALFFYG